MKYFSERSRCSVAVIMITLNEGHNMRGVLTNLAGWAQEVFILDSYSRDDTLDIALEYGVKIFQRRFRGFGDQWNFALQNLPITAHWTMKIDPDERISDELKASLASAMRQNEAEGFELCRRLWFMQKELPVKQLVTRVWRTGACEFSNVLVNEHPHIRGSVLRVHGTLEHHDSPNLDHWFEKQNRYSTAEALSSNKESIKIWDVVRGTGLDRRRFLKRYYHLVPFRFTLLFFYNWFVQGAVFAGWPGYVWSRLRSDVMRFREYKKREFITVGAPRSPSVYGPGAPDSRFKDFG